MPITKKDPTFRILLWFLVLCNMGVIFFFSSQPANSSLQTSGCVIEAVARVLVRNFDGLQPAVKEQIINSYQLIVRKAAHFLEFALLGLLLMAAWAQYPLQPLQGVAYAFGMAIIYALFDETHQWFVSGRSPMFMDVGIDVLGAVFGLFVFWTIQHRLPKSAGKANGLRFPCYSDGKVRFEVEGQQEKKA